MSSAAEPLSLFAICAPGLEEVLEREMRALRIEPGAREMGGLAFEGTQHQLYRANLCLRTASRVIARVGEFHARALGELERRAAQQPWARFLDPRRALRLRVTCRKSRLFHTGAVAERVAAAIERAVGASSDVDIAPSDDEEGNAQLVIVRLLHDRCTLSVDSSGALLHRRGYRLATAKAPLRETLAAAMLFACEWDAAAPLLDPMCGAGTIAIEGALIARRIAPGVRRGFAFQTWPEFDAALWDHLLDEARSGERASAPAPIQASDRDAGAIEAAIANAERAAVERDVELSCRALSAVEPPARSGWLVTNPPYGVRVGERDRLRNLYAQLGRVARRKCAGWTLAMLSADAQLDRQLRMELDERLRTINGGLRVRLVSGVVPEDA